MGAVPVRFDGDGRSGEMTQPDPEFGAELDAAEVARLCGLVVDDLDRRAAAADGLDRDGICDCGAADRGCTGEAQGERAGGFGWLRPRGARWFYVLAPAGGEAPAWRARMQFNGGEDPATGSAAGCAISYLVQRGAVAAGKRVHLRQGVEMGRSSEIYFSAQMKSDPASAGSAKVSEVRVGGSTVLVAIGRLFLP